MVLLIKLNKKKTHLIRDDYWEGWTMVGSLPRSMCACFRYDSNFLVKKGIRYFSSYILFILMIATQFLKQKINKQNLDKMKLWHYLRRYAVGVSTSVCTRYKVYLFILISSSLRICIQSRCSLINKYLWLSCLKYIKSANSMQTKVLQ